VREDDDLNRQRRPLLTTGFVFAGDGVLRRAVLPSSACQRRRSGRDQFKPDDCAERSRDERR